MHSPIGIRRFPRESMFVELTGSFAEPVMSMPRSVVERCGQPRRLVRGDVGRLPVAPTVKPQYPTSRGVEVMTKVDRIHWDEIFSSDDWAGDVE